MTATDLTPERRRVPARFYDRHHAWLAGYMWKHVTSDDGAAVIADACAYAGLQLVPCVDVQLDLSGYAWLRLLAVQEAWRLEAARRALVARSAGDTLEELDETAELAVGDDNPLELVMGTRDAR